MGWFLILDWVGIWVAIGLDFKMCALQKPKGPKAEGARTPYDPPDWTRKVQVGGCHVWMGCTGGNNWGGGTIIKQGKGLKEVDLYRWVRGVRLSVTRSEAM